MSIFFKGQWSKDDIILLYPHMSVVLFPVWAGITYLLSNQQLVELVDLDQLVELVEFVRLVELVELVELV